MTNPISMLSSFLTKPRFNVNQALFFFAIPVGLWMLAQSHRHNKEIAAQIIGIKRRLDIPIQVHTPEGIRKVADFDTYNTLVLSIPLPNHHDRFRECFGVARKALLLAWTEISFGHDSARTVELGRFSAFAALDAAIEQHHSYKHKPKDYTEQQWGFMARLNYFSKHAEKRNLLEKISSASGYSVDELLDSAIKNIAITRNVTGHCKAYTENTKTPSSRIDLRPMHLVSAILTELSS